MRQLKISKSITNRESASLDKYLQEIGHEELLTTDQEVELAQRIRKGDKRALERLTKANLRFVVSVAKQYHVPVFCAMTFEPVGKTMMGNSVSDILNTLEPLGIDAIGMNCSLGPDLALPICGSNPSYIRTP